MGVGIHGEPGRRRVKLAAADGIADEMVGAILADLAPPAGAHVLLLVNGFGGTPAMELYLMYDAARRSPCWPRSGGRALAGRQLRHLARDGRLLAHGHAARRRADVALGRAGPHAGPAPRPLRPKPRAQRDGNRGTERRQGFAFKVDVARRTRPVRADQEVLLRAGMGASCLIGHWANASHQRQNHLIRRKNGERERNGGYPAFPTM